MVLGVVADTHIPDRARRIHPAIARGLRAARVTAILHAGDACTWAALEELKTIAPVTAVRGNRDVFMNPPLPKLVQVVINGRRIGLLHGHGTWREYWLQKLFWVLRGYHWERFARMAETCLPEAEAWVYGHSHLPENRRVNGRLLFNPGSALGFRFAHIDHPPSYGLLHVPAEGEILGEIVEV